MRIHSDDNLPRTNLWEIQAGFTTRIQFAYRGILRCTEAVQGKWYFR